MGNTGLHRLQELPELRGERQVLAPENFGVLGFWVWGFRGLGVQGFLGFRAGGFWCVGV